MNIQIPNDVVFRDLAGEAVLLNLSTGVYFGLDPVGTRIWHFIATHGATDKVVAALLDEFDVEQARLQRDVEELIGQLLDKGLLRFDAEQQTPAR